jgi:glycosyltransferase involved in cell wall biosynthesis
MHIAIDARAAFSTTGMMVRQLITHLGNIDHQSKYTVIIPRRGQELDIEVGANFRFAETDIQNYSLAEQLLLPSLLNRIQADVVHFCMPQQPLFLSGPRITTFHDLTMLRVPPAGQVSRRARLKRPIAALAFPRFAHNSDHIVCDTKYVREEVIEAFQLPPDRVSVISLGVHKSRLPSKPLPIPFKRFLLYVGQHAWHKNLLRLCDAHQGLLDIYPDLGLVFAGKDDGAALITKRYIAQQGYRNIHFTGSVDDAQRDWLYSECAAYAFPSLSEGFGLPGLEAMAAGAPVVSSSGTCLPEVYGDAAFYFNPFDVVDMRRALDRVLSDADVRQSLIAMGAERVKAFSYRDMANSYLSLYCRIAHLARKRNRGRATG